MKAISPFALGATLYMPATRDDILDVVFGMKIPELRSLVVCLEDAVAAIDVESALANLQALLMGIQARGGRPEQGPLLFLRPRDAEMAAVLNGWPLMKHVNGFVVPKLTLKSLPFGKPLLATLTSISCQPWKRAMFTTRVPWWSSARL